MLMDTVQGSFIRIVSSYPRANEWGKSQYCSHFLEAQKTKSFPWGHTALEYDAKNPAQASPHKKIPKPTSIQNSAYNFKKFMAPLKPRFFGPLFKALHAEK